MLLLRSHCTLSALEAHQQKEEPKLCRCGIGVLVLRSIHAKTAGCLHLADSVEALAAAQTSPTKQVIQPIRHEQIWCGVGKEATRTGLSEAV